MKTTVELSEPLLRKAKEVARREGTTLRALLEEGLRAVLEQRRQVEPFRLRDGTFRGEGPARGVDLRDWDRILELGYEGRGS